MRLSNWIFASLSFIFSTITISAQVPRPAPAALPSVMYECESAQCGLGNDGVWIFEGDSGRALWQQGARAALSITRFDGKNIVIDRADPPGTVSSAWAGPDGYFRAHYVGTVRGNEITGNVTWTGRTTSYGQWKATIATTVCGPGCQLDVDRIIELGDDAYKAHLLTAALRCMTFAADQGNADGQGMEAYILYKQGGTAAQLSRAFHMAQESANRNSPIGMIAIGKMYQAGAGTPADPMTGKMWIEKGRQVEQAQEAAAQAQGLSWQQLLALAIVAGSRSGGGDSDSSGRSYPDTVDIQRRTTNGEWYSQGGANGGAPSGWKSGDPVH